MRTRRWLALATFAVVVLLTGCAQAQQGGAAAGGTTGPTSSPGGKAMDRVTITRTGGFAGVNQELTVMPDGGWTYTDKRSGNSQRGQLTADQMTQLGRLVSDPNFAQARAASRGASCADTFIYTVAVGDLSINFDECNGKDQPAVKAVIDFVSSVTAM
jgi:hypothetical protein